MEEQELYGDVLETITDHELKRDCGVHDAADRAGIIDTFQTLLRHGISYFEKEVLRDTPAVCLCICVYVYITYMHEYILTYICIFVYVYIHTYIYMHTYV